MKFNFFRSTDNALDIYCAQLKYQDLNKNDTLFVSSFDEIQNPYFKEFAKWIEMILSRKSLGIAVNKYKQLALFIAGAVELFISYQIRLIRYKKMFYLQPLPNISSSLRLSTSPHSPYSPPSLSNYTNATGFDITRRII
ncbi:hypothetical protein [Dapis sp. BLCC M229]|uniref:hypothetical protein n=1 Tax=Dapis sp. BLCC M229 TaxID=3400188 RepID=UPI003CFA51D7